MQQCMQPTGTNSSIGLISLSPESPSKDNQEYLTPHLGGGSRPARSGRRFTHAKRSVYTRETTASLDAVRLVSRRPGGHSEGPSTRSHLELGSESLQRPWYCVSRRGRVGRCQVFWETGEQTRATRIKRQHTQNPITQPPSLSRIGEAARLHRRSRTSLTRGGAAR